MLHVCRSVFMWVPEQLEQGLSLELLPVCGACYPVEMPCLVSVERMCLALQGLDVSVYGDT